MPPFRTDPSHGASVFKCDDCLAQHYMPAVDVSVDLAPGTDGFAFVVQLCQPCADKVPTGAAAKMAHVARIHFKPKELIPTEENMWRTARWG